MSVRRTGLAREKHDLGALRLCREDLEAIAKAVAEVGSLAIRSGDFEATAVKDFGALPERLESLSIRGARIPSSVEVKLDRRSAVVILMDPDTLASGVLVRIRQACEPGRRRGRTLLGPPGTVGWATLALAVTGAVGPGLVVQVFANHARWSRPVLTLVSLAAVVAVGLAFLIGFISLQPWVTIVNSPRAECPTYWRRTKDAWVIGVVTGVASAVIGFVLGVLTA